MLALEKLKRHLRPGQVYRRAELAGFSGAVDRHLRQLVDAGELRNCGRASITVLASPASARSPPTSAGLSRPS